LPAVTPSFPAVPEYRFLARHSDSLEEDFLCSRSGCFRFRPQVIRQLASLPQTKESVEYVAAETLSSLVSEDQVVLRNKAVFLVVPFGLNVEVAS
jgi:hypothetical protein